MVRAVVLLGLAALGACHGAGGDSGPPCSAVAQKFLTIAREDLTRATLDDATARAVTDQLPAMRDSLALACSEGAWTSAVRECLVAANDHLAFEKCEQQLTEPQRAELDRSTRGETGPR